MSQATAFSGLLRALAAVYAEEGRAGGDLVANAYLNAAESPPPPPAALYRLDAMIRAASEGAAHPAACAAREAHAWLQWTATGILESQIPTQVSDMFAVVALVGPGALIESQEVRGGLFAQREGTYYPRHAHAAEETYVMLAGEAEWTLGDDPPMRRRAGEFIHHPSEAAHATRTFERPILAAWRWSGDIGTQSYRMLEASA